ncbi:arginine--tRNA ligase [Candidatus Desulfofervidus auxilii]|uniref:Arginine--tRNA ligase n=1 Tax=Desulfofervidus auxilii TaxID=1621989 RepID=A0A7U4TIP4_DESA2|nr:arginine--tRNA ligase [Candidatus Desulfofervidus auxilii]AMM42204.1 arginine--tRNA ligase [Candidatus Desulfofervidus auxilii]
MKQKIKALLLDALNQAQKIGSLPRIAPPLFSIEVPKVADYGDFSTNLAFLLSKKTKQSPQEIAKELISHLPSCDWIKKVEIAAPGFINFFLKSSAWQGVIKNIITRPESYGQGKEREEKIIVEFVSANPTGPLHIGHGRGAAVGDTLANILDYAGYKIKREYYINDVGRQIQILGRSVFLRYLELLGEKIDFPKDHYQGEYIKKLAQEILERKGNKYREVAEKEAIPLFATFAKERIMEDIKKDLNNFGVRFDYWFSEKDLIKNGDVANLIKWLKETGLAYEKDGALWFASSRFKDEKDRVLVRANGATTYFASDLAYHKNKFERGFHILIDLWGADHHGYVPRLKAGIQALGYDMEKLKILLVQLVHLKRGGKPLAMSTRAGEFVTLKEVLEEVGKDAARFIFLTRSCDSHLDFDLEVAKSQNMENPVFYVQYAHARVCSLEKIAKERGIEFPPFNAVDLTPLQSEEEIGLMKLLARFPDLIEDIARTLEPHRLSYYLTELAGEFHRYYNKYRILDAPEDICAARFALAQAVKIVIAKGLSLLGVSAPKQM